MSGAGPDPKDIVPCRACGADMIFMRTEKGKRIPVNVMPTDDKYRGPNYHEYDFKYRVHQAHFMTCPEADRFRK